jgi:hypothetical protein
MNTQQAYIQGFVKRAVAHGISEAEAFELLKSSVDNDSISQPGMSSATAATRADRYVPPAPPAGVPAVSLASLDSRNKGPAAKVQPRINPAHLNDLGARTPR